MNLNCLEDSSKVFAGKISETEAQRCIDALKYKSKDYFTRLDDGEFKDSVTVAEKIGNVRIMEEIYTKLQELFPTKFPKRVSPGFGEYVPFYILSLHTHTLMNKFLELDKQLKTPAIKCKSGAHKAENDDKDVSLCKICNEPRCSVDMSLHLAEKHLAIKIDSFLFQIIEKYNNVNDYYVIKIKNVTLDLFFYLYRSNSEGGIYRLCTYDHIEDKLYKGENYVTTTYVHIQLQIFIGRFKRKLFRRDDATRSQTI